MPATQTTKTNRGEFNLQTLKQIRAEIRKEAEAAQPQIRRDNEPNPKPAPKK